MNSLVVQWLGLHASTTGGSGLIPGQRTKIPHATGQLSPRVTIEKSRVLQGRPSTGKIKNKNGPSLLHPTASHPSRLMHMYTHG